MKIEPYDLFKALSVENRIKIIKILKLNGAIGAKEISEKIGISISAVSQHLNILKQVGIVKKERKGYWIPYSINEEALENCRKVLNDICTCGCKDKKLKYKINLKDLNIDELKKYEKEIRNTLKNIQERIDEIES